MKRFLFFVMVTVASGPALADEAVLNGSRMYYEDRGRGEPVVLLHGFTLDSRMWDQQRPLARNYRLVAADMRFHGRSAAAETSAFTAAEAADDVVGGPQGRLPGRGTHDQYGGAEAVQPRPRGVSRVPAPVGASDRAHLTPRGAGA